jgi:hypothetical protein
MDNATNGRASDDAAKVFKVGRQAIQQAKALLAEALDLASQVDTCVLSLAAPYAQHQDRQKEARRREREMEKVGEYKEAVERGEVKQKERDAARVAEYADAISSGERERPAPRDWGRPSHKRMQRRVSLSAWGPAALEAIGAARQTAGPARRDEAGRTNRTNPRPL